jgi:hypothetical protein
VLLVSIGEDASMQYDAQQPMSDARRLLVVLTGVGVAVVAVAITSAPGAYEFVLARPLVALFGVGLGVPVLGYVAFRAHSEQDWVKMLLAGCVAGIFLWVGARATSDAISYRFADCWVVSSTDSSTVEECAPDRGEPSQSAGQADTPFAEGTEGRYCAQTGTRQGGVTVWRCEP